MPFSVSLKLYQSFLYSQELYPDTTRTGMLDNDFLAKFRSVDIQEFGFETLL